MSDTAHCKTVSSHLFLWPTASEWQCTFCQRQSCHIFCYDAQQVSGIAHFVKGFLFIHDEQQVSDTALYERLSHHIFSYGQQQVSDIVPFVNGSFITCVPITNSLWVTCTFCKKPVHIFPFNQQEVSDIANILIWILSIPHFMDISLHISKWAFYHTCSMCFFYIFISL